MIGHINDPRVSPHLDEVIVPVEGLDIDCRGHAFSSRVDPGSTDRACYMSRMIVGRRGIEHAHTTSKFLVSRQHGTAVPDSDCVTKAVKIQAKRAAGLQVLGVGGVGRIDVHRLERTEFIRAVGRSDELNRSHLRHRNGGISKQRQIIEAVVIQGRRRNAQQHTLLKLLHSQVTVPQRPAALGAASRVAASCLGVFVFLGAGETAER